MLRKVITIGLIVTVFGISAMVAASTPDSPVYEFERLVEEAQVELTESDGEKALLESEYAQRRIAELEVLAEQNTFRYAERIMGDLERHELNIEMWVSKARASGEAEGVLKQVEEMSMERHKRLVGLLGDERLPEEAKAGIEKVLLNQEKAMEKMGMEKAEATKGMAEQGSMRVNEDNGQQRMGMPETEGMRGNAEQGGSRANEALDNQRSDQSKQRGGN